MVFEGLEAAEEPEANVIELAKEKGSVSRKEQPVRMEAAFIFLGRYHKWVAISQ